VADGKKSMAYSVVRRAADHTLTDAEAEAAVARILKKLEAAGATLRS
jgi:phenylalanyl-tRNA synthetase beta chain